jgi:RecG-like helicase
MLSKFNRSMEDIDREKLGDFATAAGGQSIASLAARQRATVAGEIKSVRIVPRAGAPAMEVQIADGGGTVTAVFLGRRKIGGVVAGRKLIVSGLVMADGKRLLMYNPLYELV